MYACKYSTKYRPSFLINLTLLIAFLFSFLEPPAAGEDIICESVVSAATGRLIRSDVICWDASKSRKIASGRGKT